MSAEGPMRRVLALVGGRGGFVRGGVALKAKQAKTSASSSNLTRALYLQAPERNIAGNFPDSNFPDRRP
jgi:hypothetical protein